MAIDWITVAAQVVNFLILVWLLRRVLFRPVARAMAAREARLEARGAEAARLAEAARAEAAGLEAERASLEAARERLMAEARAEAAALRHRLEETARAEVDARRQEWTAALEDERAAFLAEIRDRAARQVTELARSALAGLADVDLEAAVVRRFLAALDDEALDGLVAGEAPVRVASGFDLGPAARQALAAAICARLGPDAAPVFAREPALLMGVRLAIGARVVEWSLADYLDRFAAALDERLAEARGAGAIAA